LNPRPRRLRQAHATSKRAAAIAGPAGARGAAGAVAAAARELRPVEIVGVFEAQREAAEAELAVLRQEVCRAAALQPWARRPTPLLKVPRPSRTARDLPLNSAPPPLDPLTHPSPLNRRARWRGSCATPRTWQ
jgi:hypothetical protein